MIIITSHEQIKNMDIIKISDVNFILIIDGMEYELKQSSFDLNSTTLIDMSTGVCIHTESVIISNIMGYLDEKFMINGLKIEEKTKVIKMLTYYGFIQGIYSDIVSSIHAQSCNYDKQIKHHYDAIKQLERMKLDLMQWLG